MAYNPYNNHSSRGSSVDARTARLSTQRSRRPALQSYQPPTRAPYQPPRPVMQRPTHSKPKSKSRTSRAKGIVPASIIRRRAKGDGVVEEYVYDILRVIQDDVEKAMEDGRQEARTELQTEFNIPPLPRVKAQQRVYYYVLKELTMCDYRPQIEIIGNKSGAQTVYVHTKWLTEDDEDEESYMNKFIKSHSRMTDDDNGGGSSSGSRRRRRPSKR